MSSSSSSPSPLSFAALHDNLKAHFAIVEKVASDSFLVKNFCTPEEAKEMLTSIDASVRFLPRDDPNLQFTIYGKKVGLPRDKAFYGDVQVNEEKKEREEPFYKYAKDVPPVQSWKDHVLETMATKIKGTTGQSCNHVVVNQYRSGQDSISEHHDKSKSFFAGSSVLTVSLGATRILRLKKVKGKKVGTSKSIELPPGSLFVLGPKTNAKYKHAIPKTKQAVGRRVSLTYRAIADTRIASLN